MNSELQIMRKEAAAALFEVLPGLFERGSGELEENCSQIGGLPVSVETGSSRIPVVALYNDPAVCAVMIME